MKAVLKKPFIGGLIEGNIDSAVYHDVLKTYTKECISFLDYGNMSITQAPPSLLSRVEFTECEISPFHKHNIPCVDDKPQEETRKASLARFSQQKIDFSRIQRLLINAYSPDDEGHRPYPSAGGLYPVEPLVFLFEERINDFGKHASGCYHFRPVSKTLQLIKPLSFSYFFDHLLHGYMDVKALPNIGILYLAHIGKAIFKYRYRGYRHALMEAGAMYQQAMHCSQQMGLRNTVWSTFSEQEILFALELDWGSYMPLTMQFFGLEETQNEPS